MFPCYFLHRKVIMKHFRKKICASIFLVWSLSIFFAATAYAYSLNPLCVRFQNSGSLKYKVTTQGDYFYGLQIGNAIGKWNTAANLIYCSYSANNTNIYFYTNDYGNTGWAGQCRYPNITLPNTSTIKLNEYYIGNPIGDPYNSNYALNASLHELGHAYGLNHSPSTSSVMYNQAQPSVTNIWYDDANGVNAKYN